jgi:hypothetical protein
LDHAVSLDYSAVIPTLTLKESKMNIAKHMEAIFFVAVTVCFALAYATTQAPVITVTVSARGVAHAPPAPATLSPARRVG